MIIIPHSTSSKGTDWNSERLNNGPEMHSHDAQPVRAEPTGSAVPQLLPGI